MDNAKKGAIVVCIFMIAMYFPSVVKFFQDQNTINHIKSAKESLKTVDLSNVVAKGDKSLGVDLKSNEVFVNNQRVTKIEEVIEVLGNDYAIDIYGSSSYKYKNCLYVDKNNNLELYVTEDYRPYLFIRDLNRSLYSTVDLWPSGDKFKLIIFQIGIYPFTFSSPNRFMSPQSLAVMPIIYFILFIPTMLAIVFNRYRVIGIVVQLLVLLVISVEFLAFASRL